MSPVWRDILLVALFIVVGAFFVMAELALVSLRESQAKSMEERGRRGAAVARLSGDPNRFLSAVQIGVTLSGFLSAAFGGATLSGRLAPVLVDAGLAPGVASTVALVMITVVISYFSLVFGELAPKRLALQRAEGVSLLVAPTIDRIATLCRPIIWLLSKSTDVVVRLLGGDPAAQREEITDAEIRDIVAGSETLGEEERHIVAEVFEAGDRQIREVMIPRTEADFLEAGITAGRAAYEVRSQPHSRYPVIGETHDDVIGFVHMRDLLDPASGDPKLLVRDLTRSVLLLPMTRPILAALSDMRRDGAHIAIVVDEYGGTAGIVTMEDLVEELIGDIRDEYDADEPETTRHLSGELEVDGLLNLDDFEDETTIELPEGPYETVAGYLIAQIGRMPQADDVVTYDGYRLQITEVDGRRISRVRVSRDAPAAEGGAGATPQAG